eukprot:224805_1
MISRVSRMNLTSTEYYRLPNYKQCKECALLDVGLAFCSVITMDDNDEIASKLPSNIDTIPHYDSMNPFLLNSSNNTNITFPLCKILPPTPEECAQIPLCGAEDLPNVTAIASICSVQVSLTTCLGGFMWMEPLNASHRPPSDISPFRLQLPDPNTSKSSQCGERIFPFTRACCPGHYCLPSMYCMMPCDQPGSYCPSSDTVPYSKCSSFKLGSYAQLIGCGGPSSPYNSCPSGYYCPNSTSKQLCPRGYYCRQGSVEPFKCTIFMQCPPGTALPGDTFISLILGTFLLISLLFLIQLQKNKERCMRLYRWMYKKRYHTDFDQRNKSHVQTMFAQSDHKIPLLEFDNDSEEKKEENGSASDELSDVNSSMISWKPAENEPVNLDDAKKLRFFVDIEFNNLSLHLKTSGKTILSECSGRIHCGTINAIMGPSGAGKTSFLYTLCGKAASYGNITGDILINGEQRPISDFKDVVGFVPQSDAMTPQMTVKEMLEFNANFRLSADAGYHYKKSVVRDVMKLLKIQRIRHSLIGDDVNRGISGGQQKRVNIGMELVSQPSVLFLDEPTSGLDSTTSNDVMDVLKLVAKRGTMVVVVLHQPRYEIFKAFDNVILLAEGGKMVYMGNTANVMQYFEQFDYVKPDMVNPADFIMDIVSGAVPSQNGRKPDLIETWKTIDKTNFKMKVNDTFIDADKDNSQYTPRKHLNFFHQTLMCCSRAITTMFRQKWNMVTDIVMIVFMAFVAGFGADSSNIRKIPTNVYLGILSSSLVGSIISLKTFGNDRVMYWRFSSSGINRFSYFIGGQIASAPWIVFEPIWFLMFYWPMSKPRGKLMVYFEIFVLGMFCVQGVAQLMSVLVDPNKSTLAAVVVVLVTNFFNGFEPTLTNLSGFGEVIATCAYSRWQHEALWNEEMNSWPQSFDYVKEYQQSYFGWKLDDSAFSKDIQMMLIIGFIFRIGTFLALRFANRAKQI